MGTYRKKRSKLHVGKYHTAAEHRHMQARQRAAQQREAIAAHGLASGQYFQRYYENLQTKQFGHPLFNLSIPTPSVVEAQFLNDEVDMYLYRVNAMQKFKSSSDMLENLTVKAIPSSRIVPPRSFPRSMIEEKIFDSSKIPEKQAHEYLKKRVEQNVLGDFFVGDLEAMRVLDSSLKEQVKKLEDENQSDKDEKISGRYILETEVQDQLHKLYAKYAPGKIPEYKRLYSEILDDFHSKTGRKIEIGVKMRTHSVERYSATRKGVTYAEYKAVKQKLVKEVELKKQQEEKERRRKKEEEEQREKKKREEEERRRERLRKEQEAREKAKAEEAEKQLHAREEAEKQLHAREEAEKQLHAGGKAVPPQVQASATSVQNDDQPDALNDLFGTGSGSGFDFGNLYTSGEEDIDLNNGNGTNEFEELNDHMFLGNLE